MSVSIRPTQPSDSPALSRICLLTAAAGASAEALHTIPDLPGLVYALPYNKLETTFGFVLVNEENGPEHGSYCIVGYILGTSDTRKYEELAEGEWWPNLRKMYPITAHSSRTSEDRKYISVIHSPHRAPDDVVARFPAHIHIDILPSHQRKSHGRALMTAAVKHLREWGQSGLHVGLDPLNESAKRFYSRLGFSRIDTEGGEWWELNFDEFT